MDTHNRLFKGIAHILIGVMWVQPLFTIAAELRVDTQAGVIRRLLRRVMVCRS